MELHKPHGQGQKANVCFQTKPLRLQRARNQDVYSDVGDSGASSCCRTVGELAHERIHAIAEQNKHSRRASPALLCIDVQILVNRGVRKPSYRIIAIRRGSDWGLSEKPQKTGFGINSLSAVLRWRIRLVTGKLPRARGFPLTPTFRQSYYIQPSKFVPA